MRGWGMVARAAAATPPQEQVAHPELPKSFDARLRAEYLAFHAGLALAPPADAPRSAAPPPSRRQLTRGRRSGPSMSLLSSRSSPVAPLQIWKLTCLV
jgi:hypothetical protein